MALENRKLRGASVFDVRQKCIEPQVLSFMKHDMTKIGFSSVWRAYVITWGSYDDQVMHHDLSRDVSRDLLNVT